MLVCFMRDNVSAYLAAAFALPLAQPLVALLTQPAAFFRWNGVALVVLAALALIWLLAPRRRPEPAGSPADI